MTRHGTTRLHRYGTLSLLAALFALLTLVRPALADVEFQGFGACGNLTPVSVTNLADAGPGSLRDAVSQGYRTVTFAVAGTIATASEIHVLGPCVTVSGTSAPSPGITISGHGIICHGDEACSDLTLEDLRIRDAAVDGVQIANGARGVLMRYLSVSGSLDGNIDVTTPNTGDVTVQYSIIGPSPSGKNSLVKILGTGEFGHVTSHHNLYVNSDARNPFVSYGDSGAVATDTTADVRHNVIAGCLTGTFVNSAAWANIVENLYSCPSQTNPAKFAIVDTLSGGRARIEGNLSVSTPASDINTQNTETVAFTAPPLTAATTCDAALDVKTNAGTRPRDTFDQSLVDAIDFGQCQPTALTLLFQVATGTDDASQASNGSMTTTETETVLGSTLREAGYRFIATGLPAGAQITHAVLKFVCRSTCTNSVQWTYKGEASLTPATFATNINNISLRTHTVASVVDTPAGWTAGVRIDSPELAAIVQEIVSQTGWTAGNPVVLFIHGGGTSTRRIATFESATGFTGPMQLEVTYQP